MTRRAVTVLALILWPIDIGIALVSCAIAGIEFIVGLKSGRYD